MSDENQKTLDKIDRVYEEVKKQKMTFDEGGKKQALADRTIQTYRDVMKAYANYLHKEHNISDISRAKPWMAYDYIDKKIIEYKQEKASAFTLRQFAHAIHSFYVACTKSGVFKHQIKIGDKREILEKLDKNGVFRSASESKTLIANSAECAHVRQNIANSNAPDKVKEIATKVTKVQEIAGGRITATYKLKACDIKIEVINGREIATVHFEKDKGGLSRDVIVKDPDHVKYLKELKEGAKKDGSPLFQLKDRDGKEKKVEDAVQHLKEVINGACETRTDKDGNGKQKGIERDGKKFSSHSFRKCFAQNQMNNYKTMSPQQLINEIQRRGKDNPKVLEKFENVKRQIAKRLKDGSRTQRKNGQFLTHKELCMYLVSVDLGHFRIGSIMNYYCEY